MVGYRYLFAPTAVEPANASHWLVALITLIVSIALSVWGRGMLRNTCVLTGMLIGCVTGLLTGVLALHALSRITALPLLQLPRGDYFGWSFDAVMIVPFLVAALANTLKAAALLTATEWVNDADWVRPDLTRIGAGVLADGAVTAISGAFCVCGANASASTVGLAEATGVTSRAVAYAVSSIFVVMAFTPAMIEFFTLMPNAVVGATFIFTACAITKGGLETIASRMLDARRTLVVGLAILTGLAVEAYPNIFASAPSLIQPVMDSPLVLGTVVGFGLNALFRIGSRRRAVLNVDPRTIDLGSIQTFVEGRGAAWGARRDVVARASYAAQQLVEVIADACQPRGPIALSGSFDEFDLAVEARCAGELLELSARRPTLDEIHDSADGARQLAGYLLRHTADRSSSTRRRVRCAVTVPSLSELVH